MRICQNCNAEIADAAARFCTSCGRALTPLDNSPNDQGDDLDFVVSEAPMSDPAFVGNDSPKQSFNEDLGIESNSNLMQQEAASLADDNDLGPTANNFMEPIGETEPPLPPPPEPVEKSEVPEPPLPNEAKPADPSNGDFLSADEKEQLIRKLAEGSAPKPAPAPEPKPTPEIATPAAAATLAAGAGSNDLPDTDCDLPTPQISERGRGIAFFYRNYIQIVGSQTIHAGDDVTVADRTYELKPKKVDSKILIGSAVGVLALLVFVVISQFVAVDTGQGRIFGIALDDTGRPYLQGATIRLTELGKSIRTNPQGVFVFENIPAGTHQLEYRVGGTIVGTDYTTVVSDESSLLVLQPSVETAEERTRAVRDQAQATALPSTNERAEVSNQEAPQAKTTSSSSSQSSRNKSSSKSTGQAKLSLQTNVEGARLKLDGNIIGAGNMTFSKLSPGTYDYIVDAKGYNTVTGSVTLRAGETEALIVDLQPMTQAQVRSAYTAKDFYAAGQAAVRDGDFSQAIADFGEAIAKEPAFADAYLARAGVEQRQEQVQQAYADYVHAGNSYLSQRLANEAIAAYNSAVEVNPGSSEAYLGRGEVYLAMGQQIAALADFDVAVEIDDKSAQAHYGLGRARFEQGNYKKATKHLDKARDLDPSNARVYQYLMLSYAAMDDANKVVKSFEKFREVATNEQIEEILTGSEFSAISEIIRNN